MSDYEGDRVAVVGGGDSALDAAVMVQERNGHVDVIVRSEVRGKAETLDRIVRSGGKVHTRSEITAAKFAGDGIELSLFGGGTLGCDLVIAQIGFLSSDDIFQQLDLRMNDDGSVAVDAYYETSRRGIFAVGDVHGDIKLIAVAWAEGIQAAIYAFKEITSPYWLNEKRMRDLKISLHGDKIAEAASAKRSS